MLNKYFEHVFCVNLERRPDRLEEAKNEFKAHNIKVEFVNGVDGKLLEIPHLISQDQQVVSRGDIGCTMSHLKVAQLAKERGYKNYFVFEDDAVLSLAFSVLLENFMPNVPDDWDMIYLGGNHNGDLIPVNVCCSKMTRTFTTHAFAVREKAYDAVIDVLGKKNDKVDICISSLHSKLNCYVIRPHIAFQRPSFSDILERDTDYVHLYN